VADAQLAVVKSTYVEPLSSADVANVPLHGDTAGNLKVALASPGGVPVTVAPSDAMPNADLGGDTNSRTLGYDSGANVWRRINAATAAVLAALSSAGALLATPPGHWSVVHQPAANVVATATKAGSAGVRHVATGLYADLVAGAVAPAAAATAAVLRDGAAGAGAIIWAQQVSVQAIAGDRDNIEIADENIVGTAGNAMTLELQAAGGANTVESVTLTGYDAT
jgi:hypothetical protein